MGAPLGPLTTSIQHAPEPKESINVENATFWCGDEGRPRSGAPTRYLPYGLLITLSPPIYGRKAPGITTEPSDR